MISFCPGASVGERQISVQNDNSIDEEFAWIVESGPGYSGSTEVVVGDPNFATINNATTQLRAKSGAAVGTYTLSVIRRNTVTGCESAKLTGYMVTKNAAPAAITPIISDVTFCADAPDLQREVRATVPASPFALVWEVVSAPAASGLSAGTQFTGNDNLGTQLRSFAGGALRAKPGAAVGTYTVEAFGRNTTTGCEGPRTTFTLTKNALPTETITADGPMTVEFCPNHLICNGR